MLKYCNREKIHTQQCWILKLPTDTTNHTEIATAQENKYRTGLPRSVLSVNVTNAAEQCKAEYMRELFVYGIVILFTVKRKKDQVFVHGSRAGCHELQIRSVVYLKTCEQQLSDDIGEPCTQPRLFQRLLTLKHTFYRVAAEKQIKIQQCGNGGVRSIAFSGNCSGEEQSGSPLLDSAKLLPVETGGRLVWKHRIHFVHIPDFYFIEFQMGFQILTSYVSTVWWTLEVDVML